MKEIRDIVQAYDRAVQLGKRMALATVVQVDGSSYRRPGARMLVTEEGEMTGAISGGCLEGDALRKAVLAITQDKKKLVVYDTTDEDDARVGIQLGCNGIVYILFEPVNISDTHNPVEILRQVLLEHQPHVLVTAYTKDQKDAEHAGTLSPAMAAEKISREADAIAREVLDKQQSQHRVWNGQQCFFEYCAPPVSLVLVGAGNDAVPLANMATALGWLTTVADGRPTHASRLRFPQVQQVLTGKAEEIIDRLQTNDRTAIVLMTHNYQYDLAMLCALHSRPFAYIGLLGPASKRDRLLKEAAGNGMIFSEAQLQKIFGPTGLSLGAETAEQIAVSVIAEIMAVLNHTEPQHLRDRTVPIHFAEV